MTIKPIIAAGLLLAFSGSGWAATTVFSDGDFDEIGWEEELMVRPLPGGNGTGDGNAVQELDPFPDPDADEDTYRHVFVVRDPDAPGNDLSTRLFSLGRNADFNPSQMGGITGVTLSLHGIVLGDGTGGTLEPALLQDDVLYVASGKALTEQAWTEKEFMNLSEADFSEPGDSDAHPDFSETGGEILFGWAYLVTANDGQAVQSTAGFDDFELRIAHGGIGIGIITAGINDAWFEQTTAGQGFFITALPDNGIVFLSWFTFDTERPPGDAPGEIGDPGHRWFTAQGPYAGDTAVLDVNETVGGVFDSPAPVPQVSDPIGTIVIVWQDCMNATLDYDLPGYGLSGRINLVRIAADNAALCQALITDDEN